MNSDLRTREDALAGLTGREDWTEPPRENEPPRPANQSIANAALAAYSTHRVQPEIDSNIQITTTMVPNFPAPFARREKKAVQRDNIARRSANTKVGRPGTRRHRRWLNTQLLTGHLRRCMYESGEDLTDTDAEQRQLFTKPAGQSEERTVFQRLGDDKDLLEVFLRCKEKRRASGGTTERGQRKDKGRSESPANRVHRLEVRIRRAFRQLRRAFDGSASDESLLRSLETVLRGFAEETKRKKKQEKGEDRREADQQNSSEVEGVATSCDAPPSSPPSPPSSSSSASTDQKGKDEEEIEWACASGTSFLLVFSRLPHDQGVAPVLRHVRRADQSELQRETARAVRMEMTKQQGEQEQEEEEEGPLLFLWGLDGLQRKVAHCLAPLFVLESHSVEIPNNPAASSLSKPKTHPSAPHRVSPLSDTTTATDQDTAVKGHVCGVTGTSGGSVEVQEGVQEDPNDADDSPAPLTAAAVPPATPGEVDHPIDAGVHTDSLSPSPSLANSKQKPHGRRQGGAKSKSGGRSNRNRSSHPTSSPAMRSSSQPQPRSSGGGLMGLHGWEGGWVESVQAGCEIGVGGSRLARRDPEEGSERLVHAGLRRDRRRAVILRPVPGSDPFVPPFSIAEFILNQLVGAAREGGGMDGAVGGGGLSFANRGKGEQEEEDESTGEDFVFTDGEVALRDKEMKLRKTTKQMVHGGRNHKDSRQAKPRLPPASEPPTPAHGPSADPSRGGKGSRENCRESEGWTQLESVEEADARFCLEGEGGGEVPSGEGVRQVAATAAWEVVEKREWIAK
uniref:R3H-associated N-terminal domain-containing protein n=1 Tax=Chromera velia CCMP2878 TaxID=1169474 RepID=A0A0G4FFM7_9ALVE|eukprot:Cvel_16734.t1-p1 / transcript=Cvel_16734.t1 / gene=Cvel_16734 / organism=Chromera_velia_CCMP2878 / gene_product=hypothetical protein / transcript_product=hypothetical protein / location=Cvel_scaffold1302:8430-14044(-) / protein_length=791 / sequence_SO=supercontig / SO=protein_coding / is_pseudo=false